jgi:hypothetical protein
MTDIFGRPEKLSRKTELYDLALLALRELGYTVERVEGSRKSSVRRITKNGKSQIVTIRTSQDTWIAFPRNDDDTAWEPLSEVDVVVAASVDDKDDPKFACIHLIPAREMVERFDRARNAKKKAGHVIPEKRGVWLSLYKEEASEPVNLVGAGAGLKHPPIAKYELGAFHASVEKETAELSPERFTIAEAKKKLAAFYDVPESAITITISH